MRKTWNSSGAKVTIDGKDYKVKFKITFDIKSEKRVIKAASENTDYRNNFISIESGSPSEHSKMGGNSGFFVTSDNLGKSTTAAHELGHGFGLDHSLKDQRGNGQPDIMVGRGSMVDSEFTMDPSKGPSSKDLKTEETINPMDPSKRRVTSKNVTDIFYLPLPQLKFENWKANIGALDNNVYDSKGNSLQ